MSNVVADNLQLALEGASAKLAAALKGDYSKAIELKPNFNSANSADRVSYVRLLNELITSLTAQIATQKLVDAGPWEMITEVDT